MSSHKLSMNPARRSNFLVVVCFLIAALCSVSAAFAQTKGLIVKPASAAIPNQGRFVLDPDNDGYVSKKVGGVQLGFQANDLAESEIPFRPLPLPMAEPMNDLARGPGGGFTDFADMNGTVYPVASYLSPDGNLMFRFRLGGIAPNSKGYSILVDADGRFGSTGPNADPEASVDNPGFEFEILLATNFAVRIYDVNNATGTAIQRGTDSDLPYAVYAQKAIAFTNNSSDADYFYDFYLPFSRITQYFPNVTAATPLRMVANTVMAPQSAIRGPISDIGGVDDRLFSSPVAAWQRVVAGFVPTAANGTTSTEFPLVRTQAPAVNSTILAAATSIAGISAEAAGTSITVLRNGITLGTTTVAANGAWTFAVPSGTTLNTNDRITATATATGKSVSDLSNEAIVQSSCTFSTVPVMGTCTGVKGVDGNVPGAAAGTAVRIYNIFDPLVPFATVNTGDNTATLSPVPTNPGAAFIYKHNQNYNNCNAGANDMAAGSYFTTATEAGKCESQRSVLQCFGNITTAAHTLMQTTINQSTTTLSGTITSAVGTKVLVFIDGIYTAQTTVASGTAWSISNLTFRTGQALEIYAVANASSCPAVITRTVVNPSTPPVVSGPIRTNATTITGTSTEPAGTIINVRLNGTQLTGTATVTASGTWSFAISAGTTLAAGNSITATAIAPNQTVSAVSNTVAVTAIPAAAPAIPNITLIAGAPYREGGTTVSGTGPASTAINVYIDGYLLGTVTSNGSGAWSLTNLSAANYDLYTGGKLTATSGVIGSNESVQSNNTTATQIVVECVPPATRSVTALNSQVCEGSSAQFQIANSEEGVIYTMKNGTSDRGISVLGTGSTTVPLEITTYPLTSSETFTITAQKVSGGSCNPVAMQAPAITVNPAPDATLKVTYQELVSMGTGPEVFIDNTQLNYLYQLREEQTDNGVTVYTNIGTAQPGNGGQLKLVTNEIYERTTFSILVTDVTRATNCTRTLDQLIVMNVSATPLPVTLVSFSGRAAQNATLLDWKTASEQNNARFEVEKSTDGRTFRTICKVAGGGTTNQARSYNFTDREPNTAVSYYRLKQVDQDGTFEYSKVISLNPVAFAATEAMVYPNPSAGNTTLAMTSNLAETAVITIANATGQRVYQAEVGLKAGQNQVALPTRALPAGMYFIKVLGQQNQANLKLQKTAL